jgi:membrane associated rhomboid family serine protease
VARQAVQGNLWAAFFFHKLTIRQSREGSIVTAPPTNFEHPIPSEPILFLAPVIVFLIAVCTGLYGLQTYVFGEALNRNLIFLASFIPTRYSQDQSFDLAYVVSPVAYSFLHAGLTHLAINMVWLAAFGSPLAARIGTVRFLLFWAATSVGAALLHFSVYPDSQAPMIGASGAISGMMGAAARFLFRTSHGHGIRAFTGEPLSISAALVSRTVLTFVAIWFAANLLTGLGWPRSAVSSSNIAWEAHIGGFLTGFFFIGVFDCPNRSAD